MQTDSPIETNKAFQQAEGQTSASDGHERAHGS